MSKIGIQTHGVNHKIMRKGLKTGGRAALRFGSGRTNLLEELGRVEGERSNPNRRAEISRVHSELNRGYAKGGRAGFEHGKQVEFPKDKQTKKSDLQSSTRKKIIKAHPHMEKKLKPTKLD